MINVIMEEKRIRLTKNQSGYLEAFYDVTDLFENLPNYIQKIEVSFANYLTEEEIEDGELQNSFEYAFDRRPIVENNRLRMDALTTIVHFTDERKIYVSNSEWGSLFLD